MNAQLVLIVPVGDSNLPGFGGGIPAQPGHIGGGPIHHPGHPDHGLPSSPGHPSNRPPQVPPNVVWPPHFPPHADNTLPPELNHPAHPLPIIPGQPLPPDSAFIAVYTEKGGWQGAVITAAQPK